MPVSSDQRQGRRELRRALRYVAPARRAGFSSSHISLTLGAAGRLDVATSARPAVFFC
ncbi:hypothetical protein BLAT2472_160008 [Burkholderia latens]